MELREIRRSSTNSPIVHRLPSINTPSIHKAGPGSARTNNRLLSTSLIDHGQGSHTLLEKIATLEKQRKADGLMIQ